MTTDDEQNGRPTEESNESDESRNRPDIATIEALQRGEIESEIEINTNEKSSKD